MKRFLHIPRLHSEQGQSLIEVALIFPVLVTVLVGAAEMARVARASISVSNAAKAGVQYGAQTGFTAQDTTGIQTAASNEAPNLTVTTTPAVSCVCSDGTAASCTSNSACSTSHMIETLTVTTQATVTPLVHIPGLPRSFTIHGTAVQRCLQ
jgi:Flp pilus assembly protein TadG